MDLPVKGGLGSFQRLVDLYAGDVSRPALLSELVRMRVAERVGRRVRLLEQVKQKDNKSSINLLAAGLAHVARAPSSATPVRVQVITGEAEYVIPKGAARMLLERRIAQGCRALAADIQSAGDALKKDSVDGQGSRNTAKARILVVTLE